MKQVKRLLALALAAGVTLLPACGTKPVSHVLPESAPMETIPAVEQPLYVAVEPGVEKEHLSPFTWQTAGEETVVRLTQAYLTDMEIVKTRQEDGTYFYDITVPAGWNCADGLPLTAEDVAFTLYVLGDPSYTGPYALDEASIAGLADYRRDTSPLYQAILAAGQENQDFSRWTQETQQRFWEQALPQAGADFAQSILDYCVTWGYSAPEDSIAQTAERWGYDLEEDATVEDFFRAMLEAHGGDYQALSDEELVSGDLWSFLPEHYRTVLCGSDSAQEISGIQRTGENALRLVLTREERLDIPIVPKRIYAPEGVTKGDVTGILANTSTIGGGNYTLVQVGNGIVTLRHRDGATVYLREVPEENRLAEIQSGTLDVAVVPAIQDLRWENAVPLSATVLGYAGIQAQRVKVGEDAASQASDALRKAVGLVVSASSTDGVTALYGADALPDQEPISLEEALSQARTLLETAGYTLEDGVVTEAPEGAPTSFTVAYCNAGPFPQLLPAAAQAFSELGLTLDRKEMPDEGTLKRAYATGAADIWCAAVRDEGQLTPALFCLEEGDLNCMVPLYRRGETLLLSRRLDPVSVPSLDFIPQLEVTP